MRRILLPLMAVAAAYFAYLTTLPAPSVLPASSDSISQTRITREITLPARSFYAACLGRYSAEGEARVEAARLARRGAAGWIQEENGEFAVLGALYEAQGDAISVCRRIGMAEDMDAEVVMCASDALGLRVTAEEGQLAAMEDALKILDEIPYELNTLSYSIDSGEMTADTARALMSVLHTRAVRAEEALRLAAGDTGDRFCGMLMGLTDDLRMSLEFLASDGVHDTLALSSAMKSAAISAMLGVSDMMDELR